MKKIIFLVFVSIALLSCTHQGEQQRKIISSQDSVLERTRQKDSTILAYIRSLNEIHDNLQIIKAREKIISLILPGELTSQAGTIINEIRAMDEVMVRDNRKMNALEKKLKDSDNQSRELTRLVVHFEEDLNSSDSVIDVLQTKLAKANDSVKLIERQFNDSLVVLNRQRMEIAVMKDLLSSVYYVAGTYKELKEKGILTMNGGIDGVGGNPTLKQDFNTSGFTSSSITDLHEIHLDGKFSKLVTSHPVDTYKVAGNAKTDIFFITDPAFFWSQSKYLVIVLQSPEVIGVIAPPQ